MESVLSILVHPDQTGSIKGRYIEENIRLINDIMEQWTIYIIAGILVSIDFRKGFDSNGMVVY